MRISGLLETAGTELRQAIRSLVRRPGFAVVAVAMLALGIGANTAIFSVVNGVLLRPLEFADPAELVTVWTARMTEPDAGRGSMSGPDVRDVAELPVFETLVGVSNGRVTLTGSGDAAALDGVRVTGGLLATMGVTPFLGRDLVPEDAGRGMPAIVVVSHRVWADRLGGSRDAIGQTIQLNDRPYEVVGVAPPGFDFPNASDIWRPEDWNREACARACRVFWITVGRLADGVSPAVAESELRRLAARIEQSSPESNAERTFNLVGLTEVVVGDVRGMLWVMLGAVGLVLLIACANVANLFLVRATARLPEVAVRSALGASRTRIAAHVLAEGVVVAVVAGVLGVFLAVAGVDVVRALAGSTIPRMDTVSVDAHVLGFAALSTIAVTLIFGSSPALAMVRVTLGKSVYGSGRGRTETPTHVRFRQGLLVAEVALSALLLIGAGLLLRTLVEMRSIDPGFETGSTIRFELSLPGERYSEFDQFVPFYQRLEERLERLPGVENAAAIYGAALAGQTVAGPVAIEGRSEPEPGFEINAPVRSVTPDYFSAARISVLRGRGFSRDDDMRTPPVAVVSSEFARVFFPGEDPIGRRFTVGVDLIGLGPIVWTIVGVVNDVRSSSILNEPRPEIYVPQAQFGPEYMTVLVRSRPEGGPGIDEISRVVHALDPQLPLRNVQTVEQVVSSEIAPARFNLFLIGTFAGLALLLATVGLYGVVSYLVTRRSREIGIRSALGATTSSIVRMVLVQGMGPAVVGLAIGIGAAIAVGRVLEGMLFQVQARDPLVYAVALPTLVMVALGATLIPALRAGRVPAVDALRDE